TPGVNASTVPLKDILTLATTNGSKILGWENRCGTLEPGKDADLILINSDRLREPYLAPQQSPIDALIYRGRARDLDTVMIAGEILYQGKKHRKVDSQALLQQLRASVELTAANKSDPLDEQLLPHMIRYYQAWDGETLTPHHIVNSP